MAGDFSYPVWCWHCNQVSDSNDQRDCSNCGSQLSGILRLKNWEKPRNSFLEQKTFDEVFSALCESIDCKPEIAKEYFEKDLYLEYSGNTSQREEFERINQNWEILVVNKNVQVRQAMTYLGKFLNRAAVLSLARDPSPTVRIELIRQQCIFKEAVEILNKDKSPEVIEELRNSPWGLPGSFAFVEKGFLINQVVRHPESPAWALEKIIKEFHDHPFVSEIRNIPWHQNIPRNIFMEASVKSAWGRFFIKQFLNAYGYENTKRISADLIAQRKSFILMRLTKSNCVSEARDLLDRLLVEMDLGDNPEFAQHPLLTEVHIERLSRNSSKKIREEIALRPDTPPEVLVELSKDTESTVVRRVLENQNTPIEILMDQSFLKLANNRAFIARNSALPIETMEYLLSKGEARVVENLAKNPGLPRELVEKFYHLTSDDLKHLWAHNSGLSSSIIEDLIERNSPLTEKMSDLLCSNENLSAEKRNQYLSRCSKQFILDCIMKDQLSASTLKTMITLDFPEEVRHAALGSLITLDDPIIADLSFSQLEKRLWLMDTFPKNLLESKSRQVINYIVEGSYNIEVLLYFSNSKSEAIKTAAKEKLSFLLAPNYMFREATKREARKFTFDTGINWL